MPQSREAHAFGVVKSQSTYSGGAVAHPHPDFVIAVGGEHGSYRNGAHFFAALYEHAQSRTAGIFDAQGNILVGVNPFAVDGADNVALGNSAFNSGTDKAVLGGNPGKPHDEHAVGEHLYAERTAADGNGCVVRDFHMDAFYRNNSKQPELCGIRACAAAYNFGGNFGVAEGHKIFV